MNSNIQLPGKNYLVHASIGRIMQYRDVEDHATWCGAWIEGARYTPRPLTCLWCVVSRRRFG